MPSPAVQIVIWVLVGIALQVAVPRILLPVAFVLLLTATVCAHGRLRQLLRRTRWIMLSLLAIYAWATPGEPVWSGGGSYSPTVEGLTDGAIQLLRLTGALGALAILLSRLSQQQLIGGLYALSYPLKAWGGLRARLAVRLSLTLRYAEETLTARDGNWRAVLESLMQPPVTHTENVDVIRTRMKWRDLAYLALACGFLIGVWQ